MAPLSSGLGSRLPSRVPAPQPRRAGPPVWARSAFARRYSRNRFCFLFLRLLRCFTSPGSRLADHGFVRRHRPKTVGCPIRRPPDRRPHASPRGFSQLAASFIACRRQGIRHAPGHPGRLEIASQGAADARGAPARAGASAPWQSRPSRGASAKPFILLLLLFSPPASRRTGAVFSKKLRGRGRAVAARKPSPGLSIRLSKIVAASCGRWENRKKRGAAVGAHGLGPWTSSLSETRSNQLSYAPGLPPPGPGLPGRGTVQCAMPGLASATNGGASFLPKEVIQPQVPLRLPCYDFIPVIEANLDACPPCGSARRLRVAPTSMM